MSRVREARCAFVVIKLLIGGKDYYVLRQDADWGDLNLIGGHQEAKDNGRFNRTARREMFEELSALRGRIDVDLKPITGVVSYGPVWSKSANCDSLYVLRFFVARFVEDNVTRLQETLSARSRNFLVADARVRRGLESRDISAFLAILEAEIPDGLRGIPYSWDGDLEGKIDAAVVSKGLPNQSSFHYLPYARPPLSNVVRSD